MVGRAAAGRPEVGMMVCDCRFRHVTITQVDDDGDTVTLEGGFTCSFAHCCDPVDHAYVHPASPPSNGRSASA